MSIALQVAQRIDTGRASFAADAVIIRAESALVTFETARSGGIYESAVCRNEAEAAELYRSIGINLATGTTCVYVPVLQAQVQRAADRAAEGDLPVLIDGQPVPRE